MPDIGHAEKDLLREIRSNLELHEERLTRRKTHPDRRTSEMCVIHRYHKSFGASVRVLAPLRVRKGGRENGIRLLRGRIEGFLTKEEKIEMLKEYKESLEKEAKGVQERIKELEKN